MSVPYLPRSLTDTHISLRQSFESWRGRDLLNAQTVYLAIAAWLIYGVCVATYRSMHLRISPLVLILLTLVKVFASPLAKVPGPKLAGRIQ